MIGRFGCWLASALFLSSCSQLPVGKLAPECSGVPGDFRTPNASLEPGTVTHGPGASGHPVELPVIARPPLGTTVIPLLYVYGPEGEYVVGRHPYSAKLLDPAFVQVEKEAYWGEIVDNRYYQVPQLDKCSQAAMLGSGVSFLAPPKGIMFMQFLPPSCSECEQITSAIEGFVANNPEMPVRWVRVSVPTSIGVLTK